MKRISAIICILLAAVSCIREEGPVTRQDGTAQVRLRVLSAGDAATRSSVETAEDGINSLLILFYENGNVREELTVNESAQGANSIEACVSLGIGCEFDVIALANCTVARVPQTYAEARALCYSCDDTSGWSQGIPMAVCKTIKVRYGMEDVSMRLVRLVARLDLTIDTSSLEHGSIVFTSVAVRQMNRNCPFFDTASAGTAGGVCDGDAASASDLEGINTLGAGYSTSFYLLENMQGNILEGNTDPDGKTPDAVSAAGRDPGLCTYLEILGVYSDRSGHMTSDSLVSHLFLGADAVANFDIRRNHRYGVSVTISDDGCLRTDWKIDGRLDDSRILEFASGTVKLGKSDSKLAVLNTNLSLSEADYSYEVSGDTGDISVVPADGGFTVSTGPRVKNGKSVLIEAASWDGALSTSCTVTAEVDPRFILDWQDTIYVAQKQKIKIIDKEGRSLDGHTVLYVSNDFLAMEGSGDTWYMSGLRPGIEEIIFTYDNVMVDQKVVRIEPPRMRFAARRISLPMDGAPVECGPFFYKADGTRLRFEDFDPDLFRSKLRFTITREHNSSVKGRYWDSQGAAGSPVIRMTNTGGTHDSYSFCINRLSYGGRSIGENYRFSEGPADLEYITASNPDIYQSIPDATAVLCTEDPFGEAGFMGSAGSWALARWSDRTTHDESLLYEMQGLLSTGNDWRYASMAPDSGCARCDFDFVDNNTMRLTAHYDDWGTEAMPEYSMSLAPRIRNRHSNELYQSFKRFTARCTVNLGVGGVASANASGGWDVSLAWTFPRPADGVLAGLEDIVVGSDYLVRGMYTPLYSLYGDIDEIRSTVRPAYKYCTPGVPASQSTTSLTDTYIVPQSASGGYRFVVWKYSNLYPASNGWLDR